MAIPPPYNNPNSPQAIRARTESFLGQLREHRQRKEKQKAYAEFAKLAVDMKNRNDQMADLNQELAVARAERDHFKQEAEMVMADYYSGSCTSHSKHHYILGVFTAFLNGRHRSQVPFEEHREINLHVLAMTDYFLHREIDFPYFQKQGALMLEHLANGKRFKAEDMARISGYLRYCSDNAHMENCHQWVAERVATLKAHAVYANPEACLPNPDSLPPFLMKYEKARQTGVLPNGKPYDPALEPNALDRPWREERYQISRILFTSPAEDELYPTPKKAKLKGMA